MARRIYDQPNHPVYGPVRRLHVMLLQLTADIPDGMRRLDTAYPEPGVPAHWDTDLAWLIHVLHISEARAQRTILRRCLGAIG